MIIRDFSVIMKVLKVMESPNAIPILQTALTKTVSAPELLAELQIPGSTLYRYIEELIDARLLVKVQSGRTPDGHWFDKYRTVVKEIRFSFDEKGVMMELISIEDMVSRFLKLWEGVATR